LHTYTLVITKEDCQLEFKSYEKEIISRELEVWITSAAKLLEEIKPFEPEILRPQTQKIELGEIILDKPKPIEELKAEIPLSEKPEKEDFPIVEPKKNYTLSNEAKEILQRAIHQPMPKMNEVLKPEITQEIKQKTPPSPQIAAVEQQKTKEPKVPVSEQLPQDFTAIYNQKISQENSSMDKFVHLLSLSNIDNKLDCLIACAYHLVERENFERFTLKQINTLSKALLEESIEHDTVKEALEKRFIKIVPDYTGIATTMEYTLTPQGAEYFKDVISE